MESRIDRIYRDAVKILLQDKEKIASDLQRIMHTREVYRHLSNMSDHARIAANVLGMALIKLSWFNTFSPINLRMSMNLESDIYMSYPESAILSIFKFSGQWTQQTFCDKQRTRCEKKFQSFHAIEGTNYIRQHKVYSSAFSTAYI